jgi:hypothetical protein
MKDVKHVENPGIDYVMIFALVLFWIVVILELLLRI